jgi:hypothetical protein
MSVVEAMPLSITASDASGQRTATISRVPKQATVRELVEELLTELGLPKNDREGRPLSYQARLDREGRHLRESERVEESLRNQDHLVLNPNIDAG